MAVPLDTVRAQNAELKSLNAGQVGVFVGGTAGIGEFALKAFAQRTTNPKIYIVGRNGAAAATITEQVKVLNPESEVVFIKADTSLIKNVDAVCKEIQSKEDKINFLFLTTGYLAFDGRNETSEGIDKKFCLYYYSRMRFVCNLLPELTAASKEPNSLSRVVTVLSADYEGPIVEHDQELKHNFSFRSSHNHTSVMNDFACEELAKQHPGTAFVHLHPGYVKTGIMDHGGMLMKVLGMVVKTVLWPMAVSPEESGERNLFYGSASMFAPKATAGEDAAVGSDGTKGSGAYLMSWKGTQAGNRKVLDPLREKQMGKTIWEHTLEVFRKAEQTEPHA
ncbi:hypothetical protein MMC17_008125 [Xylographa soralifera]|nr:hypothetical protein [Xylographa soralifera]